MMRNRRILSVFPNSHRNLSSTGSLGMLHQWQPKTQVCLLMFGENPTSDNSLETYWARLFLIEVLFPTGSREGQSAGPKLFGMSQNCVHPCEWKSDIQYENWTNLCGASSPLAEASTSQKAEPWRIIPCYLRRLVRCRFPQRPGVI